MKSIAQGDIYSIALQTLASVMSCEPDDFARDGFVFTEFRPSVASGSFAPDETPFAMLTMGKAIVVSSIPPALPVLKTLLEGANRDAAFSMPFVRGHSLYYLPDLCAMKPLPFPEGYSVSLAERDEIPKYYAHDCFHNALSYDENGQKKPDMLALTAESGGEIAGMAGVSADFEGFWQIGIDVLPNHRGNGLAAALVAGLSLEVIKRGIVPFYGTASSNVASQRVAHRSGYELAWMRSYMGAFLGQQEVLPFWVSQTPEKPDFSVIAAKYDGKWVFVRHKSRDTYEIPGGHVNPGETAYEAAGRELYEETGANEFTLEYVKSYGVWRGGTPTYGSLFYADITAIGDVPAEYEIGERLYSSVLPSPLTYPSIQPMLFEAAEKYSKERV